MKTIIFFFIVIVSLNSGVLAQSKKTIDSLRAKLPEIEKNDTTFFTVSSSYFLDYYFKNNVDSAIYFIEKSIAICKRRNWLESEVVLMNQLAYAYQQKGLVYKAIDINYKALIQAEKLKKPELTFYIKRVLGTAYYDLKRYDKAAELLNSAYTMALKYNDRYEQLATLNALGNLYIEKEQFAEAEKYYRNALKIAVNLNEVHAKGVAYHNLALAVSLQSRFKESLPLFEQSINLHKTENAVNSLGSVYVDLASVYFKQSLFNRSLEYVNMALESSQKGGSNELTIKGLLWKYKNLRALGQYQSALAAYENYNNVKEVAQQEEVEKRIKSLQLEYDLTQKETELLNKNLDLVQKDNQNLKLQKSRSVLFVLIITMILIAAMLLYNRFKLRKLNDVLDIKVKERTSELESANRDLIRKNEEISQALFKGQTLERKRVAVELHDNLSSLLSAMKMSFGAINTNSYTEKEKEIYSGLKEMMNHAYTEVRNISHNIMPEELERIGLQATLSNLIKKLNAANQIKFEFLDLIQARLEPKFEVNLYGIVLEIINNTLKHSKASILSISLELVAGQILLNAKDDGIGIPHDVLNGVGLGNIKNRIEALNGVLIINKENKTGTEIQVSIPV